jgi:hypothetical protein
LLRVDCSSVDRAERVHPQIVLLREGTDTSQGKGQM